MSNQAVSTLEERVAWLLKNPILLTGKVNKKKIVRALKRDGLVSKLTYWPDVTRLDEAIHQAKIRWFVSLNR